MVVGLARHDLSFTSGGIQWVLNGYTPALGGPLLLGARLADVLGRRRVFMVGSGIFALASIAAGLAVAPSMLISARVLQGIGAAAMGPAALSLVASTFPEEEHRNRAIGVFGAMAAVGWIAGTVAGGALTELLSWRWVHLAGAPVALAGFLLAPRVVSENRDPDAPRSLGFAGAAMATLGVTVMMYALSELPGRGWDSGVALGLGTVGAALLAGFVVVEPRAEAQLVPLSIFWIRAVAVANAGMLLTACAAITQLYVLTLYFQQVLGRSPLEAGLLFVPAVAGIVVAPIAGAAVNRLGGVRPTALLGATVMAAGLLTTARLPEGGGPVLIVTGAVVIEAGFEFISVPLKIAATTHLPDCARGAGLLRATNLGNALGLAVIAGVIAVEAVHPKALVIGLRQGLLATFAFVAVGFLLILVALPGRADGEEAGEGS